MGKVFKSVGGGLVGGIAGNALGFGKTFGGFLSDPLGHGANQKAQDAQRASADQANAMYRRMYQQQRADLQPWEQAGRTALGQMADADFKRDFTMADFQQDPGYDFRMREGQKALERSAAARGGLNSGGTLKALARYGQDFASNEYGNAYNRFNSDRDRRFGRLSSIAGMGQNALGQMVGTSGQYGQQYGEAQMGLGNALAAANLAKGQANQQFLGGLMKIAGAKAGGSAG